MNTGNSPLRSYDDVALSALVSEFPFSDAKDTEESIRQKLAAYGVGDYDQERVDYLRGLKDAAQTEVKRVRESKYFIGGHGGALEDFDRARMVEDYSGIFPEIPRHTLKAFIDYAIYYYFLR